MQVRHRPKLSITLDPEAIEKLDMIAERLGENRSRLLEQFVLDGVRQHGFCPAKGTGKDLPDMFEIFRRVYLYKDHYKMLPSGFRATSYDVSWAELPKELQDKFPPNIVFKEWVGTEAMLHDERASLKAEVERLTKRLEQLEAEPDISKKKGRGK